MVLHRIWTKVAIKVIDIFNVTSVEEMKESAEEQKINMNAFEKFEISLTFPLTIFNNHVYEYNIEYNLEFKRQQLFITYNYEKMEQIVNESIQKLQQLVQY